MFVALIILILFCLFFPLLTGAVTAKEAVMTSEEVSGEIGAKIPGEDEKPLLDENRPIRTYTASEIEALVLAEFKDAPLMRDIAWYESRFDATAKSKRSSAKGVFQIIDGTWKDRGCNGDPLDPNDNIKCARKILTKYGLSAWNDSRHKWELAIK